MKISPEISDLSLFTTIRAVINTMYRHGVSLSGCLRARPGRGHCGHVPRADGRVPSSAPSVHLRPPLRTSAGASSACCSGWESSRRRVSVVVFWPTFPGLAIALIMSTMGKYIFDPGMQAYIGDRVPYERRGLAIAITEFGWSLAFIVGIPLMGFMISRNGWMAPFPLLALLGALTFALLYSSFRVTTTARTRTPRVLEHTPRACLRPLPLAGISIGLWASAGQRGGQPDLRRLAGGRFRVADRRAGRRLGGDRHSPSWPGRGWSPCLSTDWANPARWPWGWSPTAAQPCSCRWSAARLPAHWSGCSSFTSPLNSRWFPSSP